jgi:ribosomal protein S4
VIVSPACDASLSPAELDRKSMPLDNKLRTLRRLFGERSFFRNVGQRHAKPDAAGTSARGTADAKPAREAAISPEVDNAASTTSAGVENDDPYADYLQTEEVQGQSDESSGRSRSKRKSQPSGGVPRAFFAGVPPRSIRNKAVSGQLNIVHLFEKQKMRLYYGTMRDHTFQRYVEEAQRARFNVDAELMRMLEMRLDTLVYRTGFVQTPNQARQWICHNQILVNGSPVNIKSARLRVGDVLAVRDRFTERALDACERAATHRLAVGAGSSWLPATGRPEGMLPWMVVDRAGLAAVLVREPSNEEVRALCRAALFPFIRDAQLNPHAAIRAYR